MIQHGAQIFNSFLASQGDYQVSFYVKLNVLIIQLIQFADIAKDYLELFFVCEYVTLNATHSFCI